MRDSFGRNIDYLRVSVTDRCNLRCLYCMPDGVKLKKRPEILSLEELVHICRAAVSCGVKKIKVSGGEPLLRRGLCAFIAALKNEAGADEVTLTTNGVLLEEHLPSLAKAGLNAVNVSLDALNPQIFIKTTGLGAAAGSAGFNNETLNRVVSAIFRAAGMGLNVKINCVPIEGLNESEIIPLSLLAEKTAVAVRFIELMPLGRASFYRGIPAKKVLQIINEACGPLTAFTGKLGNGPASYYSAPFWKGVIGVIPAMSRGFCETCNRLRLSADGVLSSCLSSGENVSLREELRKKPEGFGPEKEAAVKKIIQDVIYNKKAFNDFSPVYNGEKAENRKDKLMWKIGG